jgi:hypothetical protein
MDAPREIPLHTDARKTAQWIWQNLVPKSGQCDTVQGELLRAVEKLSWEAQNNGNINWDGGFERLIDFLERTLCDDPKISEETKEAVRVDLALLREYEYPQTEDGVFEELTEAVVEFCRIHPHLISKAIDPLLQR